MTSTLRWAPRLWVALTMVAVAYAFWSIPVVAAPDLSGAKVVVVVDENMLATIHLRGVKALASEQIECFVVRWGEAYSLPMARQQDEYILDAPALLSHDSGPVGVTAQELLGGRADIRCVPRGSQAGLMTPLPLEPVVFSKKADMRSTDAVLFPSFTFQLLDARFGGRLRAVLGAPTDCDYLAPGDKQPLKSVACHAVENPDGEIQFAVKGLDEKTAPAGARIAVRFTSGAKISAPLISCQFGPARAPLALVRGANHQRLAISASGSQCLQRLMGSTGRGGSPPVTLQIENTLMSAVANENGERAASLVIDSVPSMLPVGAQSVNVNDSLGRAIGVLRVRVVEAIASDLDSLRIEYRDATLDRAQTGLAKDRNAVVDPTEPRPATSAASAAAPPSNATAALIKRAARESAGSKWSVINHARLVDSLAVPETAATRTKLRLRALDTPIVDYVWRIIPMDADVLDVVEPRGCLQYLAPAKSAQSDAAALPMTPVAMPSTQASSGPTSRNADPPSAAGSASVAGSARVPSVQPDKVLPRPDSPSSSAAPPPAENDGSCWTRSIKRVAFRARRATATPVIARLELYAIHGGEKGGGDAGTVDPDEDAIANVAPRYLFDTDVVLANAARLESIPLPITQNASGATRCHDDSQEDAGVEPVLSIQCDSNPNARLCDSGRRWFEQTDLQFGKCRAVLRPHGVENAIAYGPQTFLVTVKRAGSGETRQYWPVRLSEDMSQFTLPLPPNDDKGSGDYTVEIRVTAQPNSAAVYRPGNDEKLSPDVTTTHPELVFTASLNPVGPYSLTLHKTVRSFLTIPVDVLRVRFPANARDLQNSTQPTSFQYTAPSTGALFVIEPWNFDDSTNPWLLNIRFFTGAYFFKFSDTSPNLSQVLGLSFWLPIVDKPSGLTDTSATINLMWEKDWRDPIGRGHYFMLTTGLNVFSLFGSK